VRAGAVDDIVVGGSQIRHVENVAQAEFQHAFLRHRHRRIARHREMHWDRRVRGTNLHWHIVVLHQQGDLLHQVIAEQVGAGDRGRIFPRLGDMAERQAAVCLDVAGHQQPDFRVKRADAGCGLRPCHRRTEMLRQKSGGFEIQLLQPGDGGGGIGKGFGRGVNRSQDRNGIIMHSAIIFFILIGHLRPNFAISQVKS